MNLEKERDLYVEMLGDLVKNRRLITEEIVLVRNHISEIDKEIEKTHEYMSAEQYINIRNSIRAELEVEMREQVKFEILNNKTSPVDEKNKVISYEEIAEAKEMAKKSEIKKDISYERIFKTIRKMFNELKRPLNVQEMKKYVEADRNHNWTSAGFSNILWNIKKIHPEFILVKRGFYKIND